MIYSRYPKTQEAYDKRNWENKSKKHKKTHHTFRMLSQDIWFWKIEHKVKMQQNMI